MSQATAEKKLDRFVALRGSIAHRGSGPQSVKKSEVADYYNHIKKLVGETGARVNRSVRQAAGSDIY